MPSAIRNGIYKHYKGKLYEVIGLVHHSETLEEFVLYKALYETKFGSQSLWVRPKKMFQEKVIVGDQKIPRFRFLSRQSFKK